MSNTIWDKKYDILKRQMKKENYEQQNAKGSFYHYTSLEVLFSILEGDEFWAANVRFSNDAMEERLLKLEHPDRRDDYVICFCAEDDMLSQWRGYCHNGGVAIKLNFDMPQDYSILHSDYDDTNNFIVYENVPLPVVYLNQNIKVETKRGEIENTIRSSKFDKDVHVEDILPYLKNGLFYEEKESRLIFANLEGKLSQCIRFRTLSDGIKVPYIVVKSGDIGKMRRNCKTDVNDYEVERIKDMARNDEVIWIDEGFDQEMVYYKIMKKVQEYNEKEPTSKKFPAKVLCRGKMPVESITVAPTYDRERKAEQIRRFCMSKYWLRNVKVNISKIPYIQPSL